MRNKKYNLYKILFIAIIAGYGIFSFISYTHASSEWWDANWQSRRKITFDNASSSENLIDFPALVVLNATNSNNIDYTKTQGAGQDIRFIDGDNVTALNYEIELWDESATSYIWVKVPQIDGTSSTDYVWMYYNNTTAVDNATTTGVWDSNFKLVTHFGSTDASASDSATGINNGTVTGATATTTNAIAGYAKNYDGVNDEVTFGNDASINNFSQLTASLWVTPDVVNANGRLMDKSGGALASRISASPAATLAYVASWSGGSGVWVTTATLSTGSLYHISYVYNGTATSNDPLIYINGTSVAVNETGTPLGTLNSDSANVLRTGLDSGQAQDFDGQMDELRYSNIVRSSSWLVAEYKSGVNAYNIFASEENLAFTQKDYRWYENTDAIHPTTALAFGNTEVVISSTASPLRLRANITSHSTLATSSQTFKLQYSQSLSGGWTDANSWWDTSWKNRRKITFNNASSSENLVNFPVLILLNATNSSNIDYSKTQNSGQDVRFVDADDQTALNYEIELWDETATSAVWVRVPQINAATTSDYIWIYYNNASASDSATSSGVWDANFGLVTHFGSANNSATDSTLNLNHGTVTGALATTSGTIAGYAKDFDGINDNVNFGSATSTDGYTQFTISMWIKPDTVNIKKTLWRKGPSALVNEFHIIDFASSSLGFRSNWSVSNGLWETTTTPTNLGFHHVAVTYDTTSGGSTDPIFYFDGVAHIRDQTSSGSYNSDAAYDLVIGEDAGGGKDYDGRIDELRYSNVIRSSEWMEAEYKNGVNQYNTFFAEEGVASTTWLFANNISVTDNATITTPLLSTSEWGQSYQENNITISNLNAIPTSQEGEWDFVLHPYNATTTTYYFRLVKSNGIAFENYENYPTLTFNSGANLSQIHYRWRNDDGNEANATFASATDSTLANFSKRMPLRLRIQISNEGTATSSPSQFQLEYGQKITSCSAINMWVALPNTGKANNEHWSLVNVANVNNGASTTNNSGIPDENTSFVAGEFRSTSNITSAYSLSPTEFTELEWALWAEQAALDGQPYCFRITNRGSTINLTYSVYPEISLRQGGQTAGLSSVGSPPATTPTTGGTQGQGQGSVDGGAGGSGQTGGGTQGGGSGGAP